MTTNHWCDQLGIDPPTLKAVKAHAEANTFSLLLVTLLEQGHPMTLEDVAWRFEEAEIAAYPDALRSLKRCRPARVPIYRDGDLYHLDARHDECDLWAFRLGLRPPRAARITVVRPEPEPLPGEDVPLTEQELDEAWTDAYLMSWSAQRLAVAVIDAAGKPRAPADVVAAVTARTQHHVLREGSAFIRAGSAVAALDDGRWAVRDTAGEALAKTRRAVRERVAMARRHAAMRTDPAVIRASLAAEERRSAARATELARWSRALLVAFPRKRPEVVTLADVGERRLTTFARADFTALRAQLATYDQLGAIEVRALLRALDVEPGDARLAELGPPQKTKTLNRRGRTLEITTTLLVQGSCGISRPFGDERKLAAYLASGDVTKLRRRLEADAKSLCALFEYGRLHGHVRLRWGFLDEPLQAPWSERDEQSLYALMNEALTRDVPLEVVVGTAPGWEEPWARARLAFAVRDAADRWTWLVDAEGSVIDDADVQAARLVVDGG